MRNVFVAFVILVVAGSLAAGFYFLGPPAEQRARRMDERRTSDLERLRLAIDLYWSRNGRVPSSLDELAKESGTQIYSQDPETRDRYEYRVMEEPQDRGQKYQMCASFSRPSEEPYGFWAHPGGRQCFDIIARRIKP